MKGFITEVVFFVLLLFLVLKGVKAITPYYWGNDLISKKISFLEESENAFNAFFIGSSETYRHIDNNLFDKMTSQNSFNLGCSGMYALETEYIFDHFVNQYDFQYSSDIYFQKLDFHDIEEVNRHSYRANYYLDWKRTIRSVKHFWERSNYEQISFHVLGFLENQLCIGQILPLVKYHFSNDEQLRKIIQEQAGYYALDQQVERNKTKSLIKRNQRYLHNLKNEAFSDNNNVSNLKLLKLNPTELGMDDLPDYVRLYVIEGNPIVDRSKYFDMGHYNSEGALEYTLRLGILVNGK